MEKKVDFKEMKRREVISYIWDYYKWYFIIGFFVLIALIATIRHFANRKDTVVNVTLVNAGTDQMVAEGEPDFSEFMEMYDYDSKEEEVVLNTGFVFNMQSTTSMETENFQSFAAMTLAGGIDVFVVDDVELNQLIGSLPAAANLEEYLPEEIFEKYADDIVYAEYEKNAQKIPTGIRIDNNQWLTEHGFYDGECVIGIAVGTSHEEAAVQMLLYILGETVDNN